MRRLNVPLLLVVAFIAWEWHRTGGPPLASSAPWALVGLAVLLAGLLVRVIAPSIGLRHPAVYWGATAVAAIGFATWVASVAIAAARTAHPWRAMLLPAVLIAYEGWNWWQLRRLGARGDA